MRFEKKWKQWVLVFLIALCIGIFIIIYDAQRRPKIIDDETAIQRALIGKVTETVSCSVTVPSRCYLYRCNTGYIYAISLAAPGSNALRCTDGSGLETVREVPSPE